jgi:hypothetical protein
MVDQRGLRREKSGVQDRLCTLYLCRDFGSDSRPPSLPLDPGNLHLVVGRRLVPHPGDHGGLGPLVSGCAHGDVADRRGVPGYGVGQVTARRPRSYAAGTGAAATDGKRDDVRPRTARYGATSELRSLAENQGSPHPGPVALRAFEGRFLHVWASCGWLGERGADKSRRPIQARIPLCRNQRCRFFAQGRTYQLRGQTAQGDRDG